jgi:glycosyltransferase involved in cell wall biosynthesis
MSTTAVTPEAVDLIIVLPSRLFGGAERTITNLIEGMAQLPSGPRVTVFAYAEMFAPHLSADSGVTLVDMAPWGLVGRLQGLRALRRDAATLADQVVRHSTPTRKAVVLCFLHYGAALAVWIKRELKGLPHLRVIASPRGPSVGGIPMMTLDRRERWLWHAHMVMMGRTCDAVVVPSEGMRHELVGHYRAKAAKVVAIPNSYPRVLDDVWARKLVKVKAETGELSHFVMATRLSGEKNIELALEAFALHRVAHPHDRLTIIGEGPSRDALQAFIDTQGLAEHVRIEGFDPQPFEAMARHDVYVHTCLIEGFGNSMLEALALGLPVVATDCDFGPRQVVLPGVNGLLVPMCNARALADGMAAIKTLPGVRLKLAARESAMAYSNFLMAARYVSLFCRV